MTWRRALEKQKGEEGGSVLLMHLDTRDMPRQFSHRASRGKSADC